MKKTLVRLSLSLCAGLLAASADARSLQDELADTLFGQGSSVVLTVNRGGQNLPLLSADPGQFGRAISLGGIGELFTSALSNEILTESTVIPVPSGSAGFAYAYNPSLNVFERQSLGLGAIFNERVNTLGKGVIAFGATYIRQDFDTYNGQDISDLRITPQLFARSRSLGPFLDAGIADASVDLDITTNSVALWGTYGVTEWFDVSMLLPITVIDVRARSTIRQGNPTLRLDLPAFLSNSGCTSEGAIRGQCRVSDFIILRRGTPFAFSGEDLPQNGSLVDTVDESRTGVGDFILRGKARFYQGPWGAVGGLTELTMPTGDEENFLGDGAFKARFLLLYSNSIFGERLNVHINGGGRVTTQTHRKNTLDYGMALDFRMTQWLSLIAEVTDSWRVDPEGLPENFLDGAFGFKVNPFGGLIASATFRIPGSDDGLRSDLVYLAGLEYDF